MYRTGYVKYSKNRWLLGTGSIIAVFVGLALTIIGNETARDLVKQHGVVIGLLLIAAALVTSYLISRRKK